MTQNNEIDERELKILLNQITFSLPCQRFDIQYSYTKQERLPIVTEFIVRLVHSCQSIAVANIQEYFGFSTKETEVIINNLINERLVFFNQDDELELTEYTKSKFADSSDDLPRFFTIEDGNKGVAFNLISFAYLPKKDGHKNGNFYVNLKESNEHISKSRVHAEKSFQNYFDDIVKYNPQDKVQLYKITNTTTKEYFSHPIPLDFFLKIDEESTNILNSKESEEVIKQDEAIYRAIIEQFSSNSFREYGKQEKFLLEFIKIFRDKIIENKLNSKDEIDLLNYVKEVHLQKSLNYEDGTEALLGNLYIDGELHNSSRIIKKLEEYKDKKYHKSLCWLMPQNSFFGRTNLLNEFINDISIKKNIKILIQIEEGQKDYLIDTNKFETYGYIQPIMGGHLEILLYAPYFVCVLFHYYHASGSFSSVSIPVGFMSENPEKVEKVRKLIFEHLQSNKNYRGKLGRDKNEQNNFKDDFCFLNFSLIEK
jgi:hypothetical protein